jgi:PAS domain S-box-containing protein
MSKNFIDIYKPAIQFSERIILLVDDKGFILSCNDFFESITGYSYRELLHHNYFDLLLDEGDRETAKNFFQRFLEKRKHKKRIITKIRTYSNKVKYIEWKAKTLEGRLSDTEVGVLALGQDVTKRVRREKRLLEQRNELIERNKELTCLYKMTKIISKNLTFSQMLNSIAQIISPAFQFPDLTSTIIRLDHKSYGDIEHQEDGPSLSEQLIINNTVRGTIDIIYSTNQSNRQPLFFLDEERALLKSIAHQLSLAIEKKEAKDMHNEMKSQLQHSDRLAKIGQLTAGVAHELNEPLGNILGFAQLSSKTQNLPVHVSRDLQNIVKSALHAREIIKKLMFFSRQTPPKQTFVDLNQLISDGLYLFESRCAKNGIEVEKILSSNLPPIKADVSQMQQVLTNLVINSIQAMPEGGKLRIETSVDKNNFYFVVQDSGQGMSEKTIQQIFLPFFTTKDVNHGTGLGLSVVHGIVKSHGGNIKVNSRPGKGSKFLITFPMKRTEDGDTE